MEQVASLKVEIQTLRTGSHWNNVVKEAKALATVLGVDFEAEVKKNEASTRLRKKPKKIDESPDSQVNLGLMDSIRIKHQYPALDKIIAELDSRFPLSLGDFKYLQRPAL